MHRSICTFFLVLLFTITVPYMPDTGEARAGITTSGCSNTDTSCTLEELFLGGSFTVNGITFDSWDIFFLALDTPTAPDFGEIDVVPLDDQPLNPGMRYEMNGEFNAPDDRFIYLDFEFNVAASNSLVIKDNSLELTDYDFADFEGSGGAIYIDEDIYDSTDEFLDFKSVYADQSFGDEELFDSVVFAPQSHIFTNTMIEIFGEDIGDSVQLNSFEQRFSVAPEPVSSILFLTGGGILIVRQLRKKKISIPL